MKTTCRSLLSELQKIWDEIGEADEERDRMLFELEQQCLDVYRRKVEQASHGRAQLRQVVAEAEAQVAEICAALGDRPAHIKKSGGLKKELQTIMPILEDVKKKRNERRQQFVEVLKQINIISDEFEGKKEENSTVVIHENDLSLKRLDDLGTQLLLLQRDKAERLNQILTKLNDIKGLCLVLGLDFKSIVYGVNPTLDDSCGMKSISLDTIQSLSATIVRLKDVKLQRLQKLQDLGMTMVELWNLMDTSLEEQQMFQNVTRTIAATEDEITEPNSLCLELINNAEAEVLRMQQLKVSKIKEVVVKKRLVLDEIYSGAHMVVDKQFEVDLSVESIETGAISPTNLLEQLEEQISRAKEEAFIRKEILEKAQKWLSACAEESWLEEYNRDNNRYNAGRGTHLMLKRAEKARVIVNKIPAMVEALKLKVKAWENERKVEFLYDGVGLMTMLDEYCELKHLKEQERQRQRDQKKLQGQLISEQESLYGSKPSPCKSGNKNFRPSSNKKFSLGGAVLQKNCSVKRQSTYNHNHHTSFHAKSSDFETGKNNIPGGTVKYSSNNATSSHQTELLSQRKALSPISSLSSNIICSTFYDKKSQSSGFQDAHATAVFKTPAITPTKNISVHGQDENTTPRALPVPVPATPPTVSTVMQTAMTPFTPSGRARGADDEEVEYSYEENRAGFVPPVLPRSRSLHLV